jgi:NAD-dependent SIR2 family protein deacetylase
MFFVGAGVSCNSGVPQLFTFDQRLVNELTYLYRNLSGVTFRSILDEKDVTQITTILRPEVLLQIACDVDGERVFQFYDWLESSKSSKAKK